MRMLRTLTACSMLVAMTGGAPAQAQSCVGFTDVPAASPFCPNVEWLKNRAITLGCTSSTLYCPNDPVTRLSMAAFLNRLGVAITPVDLPMVAAAPVPLDATLNPVICATSAPGFAVSGFPRRAYVQGAAHLSAPAVSIDVVASILVSTNNGATWTQVANSDHYATLYAGSTPAQHASLAPYGWVDLDVGATARFAVGLSRFAGTGTTLTVACNLAVQIANRNPATTPLDP